MIPVSLTFCGGALALVYLIRFAGAEVSGAKSGIKALSVLSLALAGERAGAPAAVVAGLGLGALGDFWLSRGGDRAFLAGMGAFGAGHLAYAAAFVAAGAAMPGHAWLAALGVLGLWAMLWLAPRAGALVWPVRGYILVILAMAALAAGLADHGLARAGAAAFVLSDLILAVELFVLRDERRKRIAQRVLWPLYWGAQAAILWGML